MKYYGTQGMMESILGLCGYGYDTQLGDNTITWNLIGGVEIVWNKSTANLSISGSAEERQRFRSVLVSVLTSGRDERNVRIRAFKRGIELDA